MVSNLQPKYDVLLITGFRKRKIQYDSLKNKILYYNSIKIPVFNLLSGYISQYQLFSYVISSFRPQVVIFNCNNTLLLRYAATIKKTYNFKLIFDVRSLPVGTKTLNRYIYNKLFSLNLRYAARKFDAITYITEEMKRFCTFTFNLPSHTSEIWTSAVNPQLFRPAPATNDTVPLKLIYHGTMAKKRRLDNVIKAFQFLRDIDVRLDLLGDGDALPELKELATTLGVSDRVAFLKSVPYHEVPSCINRCHAGILPFPNWPGWNTSSPIKLFEYLSCAKPVIVTPIPAHTEVLAGHDFAFWAEDSSPEALADAIRHANSQRNHFHTLGRNAREHILNNYTWQQQASKIHNLIKYLTNS